MKSFPCPLCPVARPISPDGLCKNWSLGAQHAHAHANTEAKFHFVIISLPRSECPVSQRHTLETTQKSRPVCVYLFIFLKIGAESRDLDWKQINAVR